MAMMDGLLSALVDSPAVKEAMVKLEELRTGVIQAMTHFNNRFEAVDSKLEHLMSLTALVNNKMDKIIFSLDHPSDIVPASDDGLMNLLAENGEEMELQEVDHPMPIQSGQGDGLDEYYVAVKRNQLNMVHHESEV